MNEQIKIFVSVGATATKKQESFVRAVEDRLRVEGFIPQTVGRNLFSSDAPLRAVMELMSLCSGAVVIALERIYFPVGVEKRGGPKEANLSDIAFPTPWNQIEAAIAYAHGKPLMMIVEEGLRNEGLLEHGNDWYVQTIKLEDTSLSSLEFAGVLASWKGKVQQRVSLKQDRASTAPGALVGDLTISQLVGGLTLAQLWAILAALVGVIASAFILGAKIGSKLGLP